eukprot:s7138_g1.t1
MSSWELALFAPGSTLWLFCDASADLLGRCSRRCFWWRIGRSRRAALVATVERPGPAAGRKSSDELASLQCAVKEQFPGRLYFSALGPPELLCLGPGCQGVTVLRHTADPIGTFLSFEGACTEVCISRLRAAVLSADWGRALLLWGALLGALLGWKTS